MTRHEKHTLIRIAVCLAAFVALFATDKSLGLAAATEAGWVLPFVLYGAVYLAIGYDVLWRAIRNIAHGQVFDENFLMCVATLGALALGIYSGVTTGSPEGFDEACAVLLFYQVGEFFQEYATGKSRKSITALMDIRPDSANVLRDGEFVTVDPAEVRVGEKILVNPGEKVPLDGVVTAGASTLDTRALTGESMPRDIFCGDVVVSGSVNLTSQLEITVEKAFGDSTVSKILELVENAASHKSRAENFITRFARWYTPAVVFAALALAVIPGAVTSDWTTWVYRALSFLVVSCPCALVISVPLTFFAGIGAASRYGILVKGGAYLEKLNHAGVFVFDKTGTLTKGSFGVAEVYPEARREEILAAAAAAEQDSDHPIARSVLAAYGKQPEKGYVLTNEAGLGVRAAKGDRLILCGNEKLMEKEGVPYVRPDGVGTVVHVARNGKYLGAMLITDELRPETREVVEELAAMNCRTVMLTGDNPEIAAEVAARAGVSDFKASLLPQDKVGELEKAFETVRKRETLSFVGDGINDAPVLMRSDVGIAMGGVGSDAAIEAADIVLMHDDLKGITLAKRIAKKTMAVVYENIVFSLVVKAAILVLCALGVAGMWLAVFGDVGVAVIAILNAMRANGRYRTDKAEKSLFGRA